MTIKSRTQATEHEAVRCLILHPELGAKRPRAAGVSLAPVMPLRDSTALLAEASSLASAIGLVVAHAEYVKLRRIVPASLIGEGTIKKCAEWVESLEIGLVIIDAALTPVQQRNLERALNCKIIDRVGLILEIFGARAKTHEGVLQVELAALNYQKSRLVKSWTHLERQRGGFGFLGGPGESQLEIDRRLITDRITHIKAELATVRRTRGLHRAARAKVPWPVVALAGYTNAGKSTLFNRLTQSDVMVADMVFATLDPTLREVKLPSGTKIILSDTVGFISQLPTQLIAAFSATLEEVVEADLILHVRDIAHPDSLAQSADVRAVLLELGLGEKIESSLMEVWNKSDLLEDDGDEELVKFDDSGDFSGKLPHHVKVSALTGQGMDRLLREIDRFFAAARPSVDVVIGYDQGKLLADLYRNGEVLSRVDREDGIHITHRPRLGRSE
ncbi:MAG: GTPase HflX [Candidatus Symbiobacter sp.]|nr:GTPase HflX [Candidatus Symbiobacter sp.]